MSPGLVALFKIGDFKIFLTFSIAKEISDNLACVSYSKGAKRVVFCFGWLCTLTGEVMIENGSLKGDLSPLI